MPKPVASLSLDLDNKWSYLKTHGDPGWENYPSYLEVVVPRFLEVLDELSLRITVFVVGRDAADERNHAVLGTISATGHEIGNHSFHHEPWLHLYSDDQIEDELSAAESAIEQATGVLPQGFRGPGYSLSPAVVASLLRRGYLYDASTLPTFLGPLARLYYFFTAKLNADERQERRRLFGGWSDGLRPLRPYLWNCGAASTDANAPANRLLEIPVTTMPFFRLPIHVSYLLYLRQFSTFLAWTYWRLAMNLCRIFRIEPSLLLHPLDFLGADDDPDLAFFPAMRMRGAEKEAFVKDVLTDFKKRFDVVSMREHAVVVMRRNQIPFPAGHEQFHSTSTTIAHRELTSI